MILRDQMEDIKVSYASDAPTAPSALQGYFAERLMELCQERFATLYKRVSEGIWNNGVYSFQRRPYYLASLDVGVLEYYVPTVLGGENFLRFNRIDITVVPELDEAVFEREAESMRRPLVSPAGIEDSSTGFVVAPRVTEDHARRVRTLGKRGMLKIRKFGRTFVVPIVAKTPEEAFRKILSHIVNFWEKRVRAFLEKLKIQPWQYDYKVTNLLSNTIRVIENYDSRIRYSLKAMVAHLAYFREGLERVGDLIRTVEHLKSLIRPLYRTVKEATRLVERLPEGLKPLWSDTAVRLAEEMRLEVLLQVK
jgi:hypothetical protein